jgi:hypothetical protein
MLTITRSLFALLCSLTPFLFAFVLKVSVDFAGFPDGHVTDYEKAVRLPNNILAGLSVLAGIYLIYRSFRAEARRDFWQVGGFLLAYVLLFFGVRYCVDLYLIDYLQLDFGWGG